ncbi:class I SAM-dependent methyltransferase [Bacillus sp. 31A1R]|uniref:Class I SAM-dependent methyltransferase n=1 Tax=Robertmurraya mangrovi TaxID=3098077 RepID=A0ABU5J153_9BACI|nr:class I SAM-dependent methyltransferase [Bacillus sp. 31A1R]MDZ5473150.1 class I SAM-dependent methyltransferase [Bacillus sp. 31A1R]
MIITTAGRTNDEMIQKAENIAIELNSSYKPRKKLSVQNFQTIYNDDFIVVGKERLELFPNHEIEPFFFHPNSAMFRIKRLQKNEHDPFLEAAKLEKGMSLLDCTLGLASDSIVASFAVGNKGKVLGTEGNKFLAYIVKTGLSQWDSGVNEINEAMSRIEVLSQTSLKVLKDLKDESFDCVYFDPMFEESILESDGIRALTKFALYESLTKETIKEALRVAKYRVVLKDHFRSPRFEEHGFQAIKRKSAKFHFGTIEK